MSDFLIFDFVSNEDNLFDDIAEYMVHFKFQNISAISPAERSSRKRRNVVAIGKGELSMILSSVNSCR